LNVRRLEEQALWDWAHTAGNWMCVLQVADRFGDLGLVGLVSLSRTGPKEARIVDFVMSCRAMGKRVEEAFLFYILQKARREGIESLAAPGMRTDRNAPVLEFMAGKYSNEASSMIDKDKVQCPSAIQLIEEK
jgi:FkbH-like protein